MKYIYIVVILFFPSFMIYIFVCSPFHIKFSLSVPVPEIPLAIFPNFLFHQCLINIAFSTTLQNSKQVFFFSLRKARRASVKFLSTLQTVSSSQELDSWKPAGLAEWKNQTPNILQIKQKREGGHLHYFISVVVSQLHGKDPISRLISHAEKMTPLRYALLQKM